MTDFIRAKVLRSLSPLLVVPALMGVGCHRQQPVNMAPPVSGPAVNTAPPVTNVSQQGVPTGENVFDWHDVPTGQQIPITRGMFDQSGYQLFAASGETIVVPFANQNMYVMRFGKSTNGGMYFTSDGNVPTLYVPNGGYLENSVAQGARWFPFPQNYSYSGPVYLGIAPSWSAYTGMGWYPGMHYYGGYWSAHPYGYGGVFSPFTPMVGLNFIIGGRPYYGWNSYQNYYRYNPSSAVRMRTVYNYNSVRRNSPSAFGRRNTATSTRRGFGSSSGSTGSFGSGRRTGATGSTGSFGSSGRRFGSGSTGSTGSFGSSNRRFGSGSTGTTGSFGGSSSRRPFGSGSGSLSGPRSTGSFGSGSSSGYSSSSRRGTGSFGSGSSSGYGGSFGSSSRRSFGSGSSSSYSSPSFGSSRRSSGSSFGGSSFGGSRRSSGGSFGRRR